MDLTQYEVIWGGDEAGIWLNNKQVVSHWQLSQRGLTAFQVCRWSQKAIERLVTDIEGEEEPDG